MGNGKITFDNMNFMDIIMVMSEGNPGAMAVIMQMMNDSSFFMDMLLCDSFNIRGAKLYMLYNDCCERNMCKFKCTLLMLRNGIYSQEEIEKNLSLVRAIPFIDDGIVIDGISYYNQDFSSSHEKWEEFCQRNRDAFIEKLNAALSFKKQ